MKSTKRRVALALAFALALAIALPFTAHASTSITVTVDGQQVSFQYQEPVMINNRIFVPVREVFELMGFDVDWDNQERSAVLAGRDTLIVIPAGGATFYVNGTAITPEEPQRMIGNRLMLPLRAVAEAAGGTANWDAANRVGVITTNSPPATHDNAAALVGAWVFEDEFYSDHNIKLLFVFYADGRALIGVEGSAVFEYDYWYVSDFGLLVLVAGGERDHYVFLVNDYELTIQHVADVDIFPPAILTRYHGLTAQLTPYQPASWPAQYAPWAEAVYNLFGIDWNAFIWEAPVLDAMVADGVDHKTLGRILIEDLLEFLDDFYGDVAFPILWEHILWHWTGWEYEPILQYVGLGEPGVVPQALRNLSMFGPWVEFVYMTLGVDWDALPNTSAILGSMIDAGVDHKTLALIMVEDFIEFLDDYDGYVAFLDLWEHIMADRWVILERLEFLG